MPKIIAMVLAGGRVNELGVLTHLRPKSTVPFGGLYRIIDFPLSNLMHSGIEQVGILGQYRSSSLIEHIGTGASWDMLGRNRGITILPPFQGLHASDWYKGTADAVYQNQDFISAHRPDLVLVLSGDHIYHMDYQKMVSFHHEVEADVTAAFVKVDPEGSSRFGLASMEEGDPRGGRIVQYEEKPSKPISQWASMTVYLFKTNVLLDVLEENSRTDSHEFGRDIFPAILDNYKVFGYKFYDFWGYTRTLDEYWETNMALLGKTPAIMLKDWQIRTNLDHESIRERGPAQIGNTAQLDDVRLYNGVRVEGSVKRSILFPGVHIEKGAEVCDSIIFFDTQIGSGAKVKHTICDIGVSIGKNAHIQGEKKALCVIGASAQIESNTTLKPGTSIAPAVKASRF